MDQTWYNAYVSPKLKQLLQNPYVRAMNDTRALGLVAFGVVAVLVSWSGMKAIQTNYGLQQQIAKLQQQNQVAELENNNQKLRNEYYKTDEFLELSARRQFGKAAPGEKVYLVPKKVALANAPELSQDKKAAKLEADTHKPTYQKNFEAWMNFFLHRQHD